jgi:hypothetical protein
MGERRCLYNFWLGNLRERDHWGDPGINNNNNNNN